MYRARGYPERAAVLLIISIWTWFRSDALGLQRARKSRTSCSEQPRVKETVRERYARLLCYLFRRKS